MDGGTNELEVWDRIGFVDHTWHLVVPNLEPVEVFFKVARKIEIQDNVNDTDLQIDN